MPEEPGTPKVQEIFYRANFIRDLDIRLDHVSEGICETSLIAVSTGKNAPKRNW